MKYTIELTNKQKDTFECLLAITNRFIGFNPKLEPMEVKAVNVEDTNEYKIGYKAGFENGRAENSLDESDLQDSYDEGCKKGYNTAITDYNMMFEWMHDCPEDFKKFLYEAYSLSDCRIEKTQFIYDIICSYDMREVISEFQKWYEQKKGANIKVGDIVKFNEKCHEYCQVKDRQYLVLHIDYDKGQANLLHDSGDTSCADVCLLNKTGKHIDRAEGLVRTLFSEVEE